MRAYISVSFAKSPDLSDILNAIEAILSENNIEPFVFVRQHQFTAGQEIQMMKQALEEIDKSEILIAESSDKAIGIGIEAGYAKAMKKPIVYLRMASAEHSTTLGGISDHQVIYRDVLDLSLQLPAVITTIRRSLS